MLDSVRGLHVVLLIGLACVVQTTVQACLDNHPICDYDQHTVVCHHLVQVPSFLWGNTSLPVTHLDFQNGSITSINKTSLPSGLDTISLHRHPLSHLPDDAFDLSATSLRKVQISGASFRTLPRALRHLSQLRELRIEDTHVQDWEDDTVDELSWSVEILALINVSFSAWPDWIYHFSLLQSLDLSYNALYFIPDDAFDPATYGLLHLNLQGTNLIRVSPAVTSLRNLNVLNLSKNNFTNTTDMQRISEASFSEMLLGLHVSTAGLTQMPNLMNFTILEMIDFSHNRISEIPLLTIPTSLMVVDLSYNNLTSVPLDISLLSELVALNLKGNQISVVLRHHFPSSLTTLDLSQNNLSVIDGSSFQNLTHLVTLHLDYNPITRIAESAFYNLISLKSLTLTDMRLREIPLAFVNLRRRIELWMTTVEPLSCPCPADPDLVRWYASLRYPSLVSVECTTGLLGSSYLTGGCSDD